MVEAIKAALSSLPQQSVVLRYLLSGAGDVTVSDVDLAAASGGLVLAFNLDPEEARAAAPAHPLLLEEGGEGEVEEGEGGRRESTGAAGGSARAPQASAPARAELLCALHPRWTSLSDPPPSLHPSTLHARPPKQSTRRRCARAPRRWA